ncbi:MAG: hypothetical protein KJO20_05875, partial [Eudoraea sp.]|nr:hypothetical protein [Eudoraea sp.]NNK30658.1 hypothetical protein [Flavobacteriaceae bacterium]
MDKRILLLIFLISGFAYSQTTVTLQDQCNCEVLSGTAVTVAGSTTPAGADTGDIYVNTNTGTIYFWDGDSWELTSSDDQQLQNFSFNNATSILSLDIEDGNTVTVDLSSLSSTGTDDQALSLAGNILTLEDGGTVDLSPYLDNTDDQNITNFSLDASNILTLTLEDGNTQTVDLSALLGTDDQTISLAGNTLTLEDGGSVDLTPYLDNTDDQTITNFSLDASNILTLTLENGNTQTVDLSGLLGTDDQTAAEVTYDNTASGLVAADVQSAIDEINAAAGTVALVDNGDGTYDFTDAAGNTTTISDTSISNLSDNGDGTLTYTNEAGAATTFDAKIATVVDNLDGTYTITDDFGTSVIIDSNDTITTLVDNGDGTFTYT